MIVQMIVHALTFVELNHYELCNAILRLSTVPIMVNQETRFELLRRRRTLAAPLIIPPILIGLPEMGFKLELIWATCS